jgi:CheY-like chemotaxis protein
LLLSLELMKVVPSSESSDRARILLIDDNKLGLAARRAVLEELGYGITTAVSAVEGLKRFSEHSYELIVTDYKMPRMDGVRLIQEVRKTNPDLPIILLSGFADALGLDEQSTGADIVIQKSANEVNLMVRAVRRLLRQRKTAKKPPASQRGAPRARSKTN